MVATSVGSQCLADNAFTFAGIVDVGGIDEVDSAVQGTVEDGDRLVFGCRPAKIHGSQTERGDLDAGASEGSIVHS